MTGTLVVDALQQELTDRKIEQHLWEKLRSEWALGGTSTLAEGLLKQRWMWLQYLRFQQMRGNSPH